MTDRRFEGISLSQGSYKRWLNRNVLGIAITSFRSDVDGRWTFRLIEGEPLPTSYGEYLYTRIFGSVRDDGVATPT